MDLHVLCGVHQGALVSFDVGSVVSVGREFDFDVVLTDLPNSGGGEYCRLAHTKENQITIYAVEVGVIVGAEHLSVGQSKTVALPTALQWGDVQVSLSADQAAPVALITAGRERLDALKNRPGVLRGALIASVILLLCLGFLIERQFITAEPLAAATSEPADVVSVYQSPVVLPAESPGALIPASTETVSTENMPVVVFLRGFDALNGSDIDISVLDQTVQVSGLLNTAGLQQWPAIAQAFDQTFESKYILRSSFTLNDVSEDMPMRPTSVWLSADAPHMIDSERRKVHIGETTSDGWVLQRIDADGLLLSRGEREILVSLQADGA